MEQDRPLEVAQASATNWQTRPLEQRFTVVHEIGHLFGLVHEDRDDHPTMPNAWIMEQGHNRTRATFNDKQIDKIRAIDRP